MPKITYIEYKGKAHTIEVANGLSVMEGAIQKNIPGIDADCGGSCACATCHVYIAEEDFNKLVSPKEDEIQTLETNDINQTKLSRLSCQIELKEEFNNITVTMAIPRTLT